jgi:hypothetical protein
MIGFADSNSHLRRRPTPMRVSPESAYTPSHAQPVRHKVKIYGVFVELLAWKPNWNQQSGRVI